MPDGTIEFIVDKEPIQTNPYVDNSIEIIKAEFSDKFIDYASKVVNEYNIDVSKIEGDYTFIGLSTGEIIGGEVTLAVDRQKNVYIIGTVFLVFQLHLLLLQ